VFPKGPPPENVVTKDLRVGRGPKLHWGDPFVMNYVGFDYQTHETFQRQWGGDQSMHWTYGKEMVQAFVRGLQGMRVGGRREIIAPSNMAYNSGAVIYLVELIGTESSQ